ncbi:hypothetical protein B0H14DRAFT_3696750 [Mycena olivaceomarginata]|nr:hypothetical protein B0H14DRAFT_3696750 [Mycena olivaceomarginata]
MDDYVDPDGRPNYKLCVCRAHDCVRRTWRAPDGSEKQGKWYSKGTLGKHRKAEQEMVAKGILPPLGPQDEEEAQPPARRDELPTGLQVMREEKDVDMEDETSPAIARRRLLFLSCTLVAWLHLICGLSRDASNRVLKVLGLVLAVVAASDVEQKIPQDMWHLPEMAFFVGITPPPKEPTVTTMGALLDPSVDQFLEMWVGKMIPTYTRPHGDFYRVAILAAIGDLLALKKALGCASHAAHNFCSYCKLKRNQIDRLDYQNFEPRRGWEERGTAGGSDTDTDSDVEMLDFDANTVAAELDDLHQESFFENDVPKSLSRRPSFYYIQEADDGEVGEEEKDEDEEKEEDEDEIYGHEKPSQRIFDDEAMALIHAGLAGVVIPSWIDRPPVNLGDKTHGKAEGRQLLLLNFHDLVGATHILCSYTTSPAEADRYTEMYSSYFYSSKLLATIKDSAATEMDSKSPLVEAMGILCPEVNADSLSRERYSPHGETSFNGSGVLLDHHIYELILQYWNHKYSPQYIRSTDLTFELMNTGVNVLPSRGKKLTSFKHKTRTFGTFEKNDGNSSISFRHPSTGRKDAGFIRSMWTKVLQGQQRIFVVVQPHGEVLPADAAKTPYLTHTHFKCTVRYTHPPHPQPLLVIEPEHIISHIAYHSRPAGDVWYREGDHHIRGLAA